MTPKVKEKMREGRVPLRIDSHTVALVKPEDNNPEYAMELRRKLSQTKGVSIPTKHLAEWV